MVLAGWSKLWTVPSCCRTGRPRLFPTNCATAAALMRQHGQVDIRVLKMIGHANLATTELYTHVSNTQIERAASKALWLR